MDNAIGHPGILKISILAANDLPDRDKWKFKPQDPYGMIGSSK